MNVYERQYRRTGRILTLMLVLGVPVVGLIGFGLGKLLDSSWPLYVCAGAWMAIAVVFTVQRFSAYLRWKGKISN